MDNHRHFILAALLAITLTFLGPVSAHGREGRDREKMSSLLQSLFEMKEARAANIRPVASRTVIPPWEDGGDVAGAWSGLPMTQGMEAGARSDSPTQAPLSHESPPSQAHHLGLLRVSGAAAARLDAPALRRSDDGGAGRRTAGLLGPLAMLHGVMPDAHPDGEDRHSFVRELRKQFELRQQRVQDKGGSQ